MSRLGRGAKAGISGLLLGSAVGLSGCLPAAIIAGAMVYQADVNAAAVRANRQRNPLELEIFNDIKELNEKTKSMTLERSYNVKWEGIHAGDRRGFSNPGVLSLYEHSGAFIQNDWGGYFTFNYQDTLSVEDRVFLL